jgi:hypothetical protein
MPNENDVVDAVCSYLEKEGYIINQRLRTTERGTDIIAKHPSRTGRLHIEAKGGTSAREGSPRYEREYDQSQVFDRVAKGLYTAVELHCAHEQHGDRIGLAFPDTERFRKYPLPITPVLGELAISVYIVSPDRQVAML